MKGTAENSPGRIPRETTAEVLSRAVSLVGKARETRERAEEEGGLKIGSSEQTDYAMNLIAAHLLVGGRGVETIEGMIEALEKGKVKEGV